MAQESTPEERTEMPTAKRMEQLRKEGAIFMSVDVIMVVSLLSGFIALHLTWNWMFRNLTIILIASLQYTARVDPLLPNEIMQRFIEVLILIAPPVLLIVVLVASASSLAVMLQTKWNVKQKWVSFKFPHLNPISGIAKIFSVNGFVNTGKSVFKLALILPIAYFALKKEDGHMVELLQMSIPQILSYTGATMSSLFWKILYVLIAMAIFDFFWGHYRWLRQNKMTKEEVKDERKAVEGDEVTKRRIQAKGMQRIIQRIRQSVPQADVVVTNPTHYAVALRYDRKVMRAPTVVAKGKGHLAEKIKEIARESNVPILERKPLARALYSAVEVGMEVPYELFRAVAEVLAYVYRLKNPWGYMKQGAKG